VFTVIIWLVADGLCGKMAVAAAGRPMQRNRGAGCCLLAVLLCCAFARYAYIFLYKPYVFFLKLFTKYYMPFSLARENGC